MSIVLVLGRLRQENCSKFKAYLASMRSCQKNHKRMLLLMMVTMMMDDDKTLVSLNHTGHQIERHKPNFHCVSIAVFYQLMSSLPFKPKSQMCVHYVPPIIMSKDRVRISTAAKNCLSGDQANLQVRPSCFSNSWTAATPSHRRQSRVPGFAPALFLTSCGIFTATFFSQCLRVLFCWWANSWTHCRGAAHAS